MTMMKLIIFILMIQSYAGLAQVQDENCENGVEGIDPAMMVTFYDFTSTCSNFSLKIKRNQINRNSSQFQSMLNQEQSRDKNRFDFEGYASLDSRALCECLKNNPLVDTRVTDFERDTFRTDNVRRGTSKVFKTALRELQGNITKFKNLNLNQNLHQRSKTMCSLEAMAAEINLTRAQRGRPTCQGADMDIKLTQIFGNSDPAYITRKIKSETVDVNENSCITRQHYMLLRSSPSSAIMGSQYFTENGIDLKLFQPDEDVQNDTGSVELLSYDLFFNLGYRQPRFSGLMKNKIQTILRTNPDAFHQIYNDPEIQTEAMLAIEAQCNTFKENLKAYLCNDDSQKNVNSKAMSVIVRDELQGRGQNHNLQHLVDFHTKKNACEPEPQANPANEKLNEFIEKELLLSKASNDAMSDHINSEYIAFNNTFCGNRKGQNTEIDVLTREFLAAKKAAGLDLEAIFKDPSISRELGIIVDLTKNPIVSHAPGRTAPDLPVLSRLGWELEILPKLRGKLSETESEQLFALIEMQTNVRAQEVKFVRDRFIAQNPVLSDLTSSEVDGILRGDETVIRRVQARHAASNITTGYLSDGITSIFMEQQINRADRFELEPPARNTTPDTVAVNNDPVAQIDSPVETASREVSQETEVTPAAVGKKESPQTQAPSIAPVALASGFTGGSVAPSSSKSVPSQVSSSSTSDTSVSSNSTSESSSSENPNVKRLRDEIKQIQDEIAAKQRTMDDTSRRLRNLGRNRSTTSGEVTGGNPQVADAQRSFRENYNFPSNLPVKTVDGDYYMPEAQGSELSSASEANGKKSNQTGASTRSGSGGGGASNAVSSAGGGSGSGGGSGGGASGAAGSLGRGPASAEADEKLREELKLPVYEYPRYIPHSLIDMVGSVEKVVIMLGLEGKLFKTIEAIEEYDEKTGKIRIRYYQRYFDFVPGKVFKELAVGFEDKETREKLYKEHFSFARTPENLSKSKKFAGATQEILKEEVEHNYVLGIQNQILSDDEVRQTIEKTMKLLN